MAIAVKAACIGFGIEHPVLWRDVPFVCRGVEFRDEAWRVGILRNTRIDDLDPFIKRSPVHGAAVAQETARRGGCIGLEIVADEQLTVCLEKTRDHARATEGIENA